MGKKLGHKINDKTWTIMFKSNKEIKLQEIQWKILHNVFPTNILLKRIGIKQSENCDFCNQRDFVEHYFFQCTRILKFWDYIKIMLFTKLNKRIVLNANNILLGIEQDDEQLTISEILYINEIKEAFNKKLAPSN